MTFPLLTRAWFHGKADSSSARLSVEEGSYPAGKAKKS
jgi:hypothetical protein